MPNTKKDDHQAKREVLLKKANNQIKKGFLRPAVDTYAKILKDDPKDIDGLLGMSIVSRSLGNLEDALAFAEKVLEHDPKNSEAQTFVGLNHALLGKPLDAIDALHIALSYDLDNYMAWNFLKESYDVLGRLSEFNAFAYQTHKEHPENAYALYFCGMQLMLEQQYDAAENFFTQVTTLKADFMEGWYQLGNAHFYMNHYDDTVSNYKQALKISPVQPGIKENMVIALIKQKKFEQASSITSELIREAEDPTRALSILQNGYREAGEFARALPVTQELYRREKKNMHIAGCLIDASATKDNAIIEKYYKMLLKVPLDELVTEELALVYHTARNFNDWPTSIKLWPRTQEAIIKKAEEGGAVHSLGKLNLISEPQVSLSFLKLAHISIGNEFKKAVPIDWKSDHSNAFKPSSRIRVGIVSGDFFAHVVNYFINGWVKYHDRSRFDLYCYANLAENRRDNITESYKKTVKKFTFVNGMHHRQIAETIQDDGIHILVDLTGYTEGSLIEVMTYKPAPLIMTWLGYPATTGCDAVDYVIGDKWLYTPQHSELFVEKMLVLPETCYFVGDYTHNSPKVVPPALENGYITFGSLMNPYKINPEVIHVWAEIVKRVPAARLKLNHPTLKENEAPRRYLTEEFMRQGFPMDRLELTAHRHEKNNHLFHYHDFDIALDTFKQTGGTTTLESLLMAVPIISLAGDCLMARISYSFIENCGVDDIVDATVAFTEDEYIEKAVALANNIDRLTNIRSELAANMRLSNIFSPRKITRELEEGFIHAWEESFPDFPASKLLDVTTEEEVEKKLVADLKSASILVNRQNATFLTFDDENDVYNYVLQEQLTWFDPEYQFINGLVGIGDHVIDCCDDCGLYSIPMLKQIGKNGMLRSCFRSAERKFIFNLMTMGQANVQNFLYDSDIDVLEDIEQLDFIRISSEFNDDEKGGFIGKNIGRLAELSPFIFFSAKQNNEFDMTMLSSLQDAGFNIYHYIGGLDALVPFEWNSGHDDFLVNLAACKGKAEEKMALSGKLLRVSDIISYQPDFLTTPFIDWLDDKAYAKEFIDHWVPMLETRKDQAFEVYHNLLDAWVVSQDTTRSLATRYGALKLAVSFIEPLVAVIKDSGLLLTVARVLFDAGFRQDSVLILLELKTRFDKSAENHFDLPFLAPDKSWDQTRIDDRFAEWIFAATLESFEFRRAFSSYFTGEGQAESYQMIASLGFDRTWTARRLELIRQRYL